MRKGGTTALFCAFRLEYNRNIKNSCRQTLYSCALLYSCVLLSSCTLFFLHTILLAHRPYFDVDPKPPLRLAVALSSNVMPKGRKIP
mgnify:CR=1 FL=1